MSRTLGRTQAVAVVAAGVATPLGLDLDTFWSALCTGVDGISAIERFRVDDLRVGRGGEIKKLRTLRHGRLPRCRASALLLLAADDLLARAAGVPVLPAFCVLRPDARYTVIVQPPISVDRSAEEAALRRWVAGLATVIARYPTQWFNFFDPWSAVDAR